MAIMAYKNSRRRRRRASWLPLALIVLMFSTDFVGTLLDAGGSVIGGSVIRTFLMLTGQM